MRTTLVLAFVAALFSGCAMGQKAPAQKTPAEMAEIYLDLGTQALLRNDLPQAIEDLSKCLQLNAKNSIALNHLGLAYYGLGRKALAKETFEKSVKIDPKNSDAWINLGNIATHEDNFKMARQYYEKALDNLAYKTRHRALTSLAQISLRENKVDEARMYLYQSAQLNPDYCMTHFLLGTIFMRENNAARAADEFRKSTLSTCASNVEGHFQMGLAYLRSKNYPKAKSAFLHLVESYPQTLQGQKAGEQLKYIP